jgi:hypothetical protein
MMQRDPACGRDIERIEAGGHRDAEGAGAAQDLRREAGAFGAEEERGAPCAPIRLERLGTARAQRDQLELGRGERLDKVERASGRAKGTIRLPPTETRIALR